jgi:hypothetical protein
MAEPAFKSVGDKFLDGRLYRYSDPKRLDQTIKEAAAEFEKAKDFADARNRMIQYFTTHGRFVFVPGKGWYDLMHVASAYAAAKKYGKDAALGLGWGVELAEWTGAVDLYDWGKKGFKTFIPDFPNRQSGFQLEDDRSNQLGAVMAATNKDVRAVLLTKDIPNATEAGQLGKAELLKNSGNLDERLQKMFVDILDTFCKYAPRTYGTVCPVGLSATGESMSPPSSGDDVSGGGGLTVFA